MKIEEFKATLAGQQPPPGLTASLAAMWYDGKGDWEQAHNIAQDIPTREGSLVHAYLHRKEGDTWNANYWYNRAGQPMSGLSLEEEWEDIVRGFLSGTPL